MTTKSQLRKAALALPSVSEHLEDAVLVFRVDGEVFARLPPDGTVELLCGAERAERARAWVAAVDLLTRGDTIVGVSVGLGDVNGMELNRLVYQAWLHRAPEDLAATQRSAAAGVAPAGPDALPSNLGRPATSALLTAGVDSLTEARSWSAKRLLKLHGFGPKALRLLEAALKERGLGLADD